MAKKRKQLATTAVNLNQPIIKEDPSFMLGLYRWWRSLTTFQRLVLLAAVIVLFGGIIALSFTAANRRELSKSKELSKQGFFKNSPKTCVPLSQKPATWFRHDSEVTFIDNNEVGWQQQLFFCYENNLLTASPGDISYTHAELSARLRAIKALFSKIVLDEFQTIALQGTQIRLVRGDYLLNGLGKAMVDSASGNIYINILLDPSEYLHTIEDELSHVIIRYANIVKCGTSLPQDKTTVFFPFLKSDWSIDRDLRDELRKLMRDCYLKAQKYFLLWKDKALSDQDLEFKNQVSALVARAYQLPPQEAHKRFKQIFLDRLDATIKLHGRIGGINRRLFEQVSDIHEFPPAIREFFFQPVLDYLQKYYAKSCAPSLMKR